MFNQSNKKGSGLPQIDLIPEVTEDQIRRSRKYIEQCIDRLEFNKEEKQEILDMIYKEANDDKTRARKRSAVREKAN